MGCKVLKWRKLMKVRIIMLEKTPIPSWEKLLKFITISSSSVLIIILQLCLLSKARFSLLLCQWSWLHLFLCRKIYITYSLFCLFKSLLNVNFSHTFQINYSSFITFKHALFLSHFLWELSIKSTPLTQGSFFSFFFFNTCCFISSPPAYPLAIII